MKIFFIYMLALHKVINYDKRKIKYKIEKKKKKNKKIKHYFILLIINNKYKITLISFFFSIYYL